MSDLNLERIYAVSAGSLYKAVTAPESLAAWFGPVGVSVVEHDLSLDTLGPWFAKMANADGHTYKVSGVVTLVKPGTCVEFSWAWHDEHDQRGRESQVTFEVTDLGDGTAKLRLIHKGLADEEQVKNHNAGWTSSLEKMPAILA